MRMSQCVGVLFAIIGSPWSSEGRFKIIGNCQEHYLTIFRPTDLLRPFPTDPSANPLRRSPPLSVRAENRQVVLLAISKDFKSTLRAPRRTDNGQESVGMLWEMHLNTNGAGYRASILCGSPELSTYYKKLPTAQVNSCGLKSPLSYYCNAFPPTCA